MLSLLLRHRPRGSAHLLPQPSELASFSLTHCLHCRSYASSSPTADAAPPPAAGPLAGYKVLDLGQVVAGNFCGALLAYFGADVIKVEPPGRGDALRHLRDLDASGTALWWRSYGRNRRCVTVDLRTEGGRAVVRRLAATCDVLVENFRPGVMEGWGLGPADLHPSLIYTRISGYGQTGPKAALPGYASVCEAYGGFRHLNGYPDRAPVRPNISLGDSLAGLHAAFGAVMALLHRDRDRGRDGRGGAGGGAGGGPGAGEGGGGGQVVDAAISESMFNMLEGCLSEFGATGAVRPPSGAAITGVVPTGCWRAADGVHVIVGGNGNSVYDRLMAAVGRPDMGLTNPLYDTDAKRCQHEDEICRVIAAWVAGRPSGEVVAALGAARVPAGPILSIADIAGEAQYQARGMLQRAAPPSGGPEVLMPAMAPLLSATPGSIKWAGPELGEHTEEVLTQELGMTAAEVAALRAEGAI